MTSPAVRLWCCRFLLSWLKDRLRAHDCSSLNLLPQFIWSSGDFIQLLLTIKLSSPWPSCKTSVFIDVTSQISVLLTPLVFTPSFHHLFPPRSQMCNWCKDSFRIVILLLALQIFRLNKNRFLKNWILVVAYSISEAIRFFSFSNLRIKFLSHKVFTFSSDQYPLTKNYNLSNIFVE